MVPRKPAAWQTNYNEVETALGTWRSDAGLDLAAIVFAHIKPVARRLRRWPA